MPEQKSTEEKTLPSEDNPKKFMRAFRKSRFYENAYNDFFKGKKLTPDVTDKDKTRAFEESETAKFALVDFGVMETRIKLNSDKYPVGSQQAIYLYIESVKDFVELRKKRDTTQDEIASLDRLRFRYHSIAADQLVDDKIVPTAKLGRALCRLLLIDQGLDTPDNARQPDVERVERLLGII